MGCLLITAAIANQYLWRQPTIFSLQVDRARSWKEFEFNLETIIGEIDQVFADMLAFT